MSENTLKFLQITVSVLILKALYMLSEDNLYTSHRGMT